jgi:hypothetical protein
MEIDKHFDVDTDMRYGSRYGVWLKNRVPKGPIKGCIFETMFHHPV